MTSHLQCTALYMYLVLTIYGSETEAVGKDVDPRQGRYPGNVLRLLEKVSGEVESNGGVNVSSTVHIQVRRGRERGGWEQVNVYMGTGSTGLLVPRQSKGIVDETSAVQC